MPLNIKQNIPLAPYTTLKIGGPADYFVDVSTPDEIIMALMWAKKNKVPFYILGNGSNVLISDAGFRGLIIHIKNTHFDIQGTTAVADAGVSLPILAKETTKKGLSGLEFFIGVPGSVGGAVYGNAGAFEQETKNMLLSVRALLPRVDFEIYFVQQSMCSIVSTYTTDPEETIVLATISSNACEFSYRESIFKKHKNWIIVQATFDLVVETAQECLERMEKMLTQKTDTQPMGTKAAGSIFKNPDGKHAWELIVDAEMQGFTIGGAQVSGTHANYIINVGNATAEHFMMLIALIKQRVRVRCGVQLQEEIQFVGFDNPL